MKQLSTTLLLVFASAVYSQVGVFNDKPRGALDINKVNSTNGNYYCDFGLTIPVIDDNNNNPDVFNSASVINPITNAPTQVAGTLIYDVECDGVRFMKQDHTWSQCLNDGTN